MKSILTLLTFIILFTSCASYYHQSAFVSSKCYIGMPLEEFKKLANNKAKIEALENNMTVYRMNDFDAWTGVITDTKFYYFDSNGKLLKIDGGVLKSSKQSIDVNIKKN